MMCLICINRHWGTPCRSGLGGSSLPVEQKTEHGSVYWYEGTRNDPGLGILWRPMTLALNPAGRALWRSDMRMPHQHHSKWCRGAGTEGQLLAKGLNYYVSPENLLQWPRADYDYHNLADSSPEKAQRPLITQKQYRRHWRGRPRITEKLSGELLSSEGPSEGRRATKKVGSPVPVERIEFHITGADGNISLSKARWVLTALWANKSGFAS